MIQLKRAYDSVEEDDGCRVLVDRLWPRGVSKEELNHDYWLKELAPSDKLRQWFDHDPKKFDGFRQRYHQELKTNNQVDKLITICQKHDIVTFVYAAEDRDHNNAVALKEYLEQQLN